MRSLFTIALFIAASVSATPDFGGMIKGALRRFSHSHKVNAAQDWPKVHFPDNFNIQCIVNQWDEGTKSLVQYKNMSMSQSIDSDGNRELVHMLSDIDGLGYVDVQTYADFNTNIIHQKIESIGVCQKTPSPFPIPSLREFMHKVQDPQGGITQYLGVVTQPWAKHDLHAFELTMDLPNVGTKSEVLYFCTETLDVKFITVPEYANWVISVPSLTERKFTDADFQNVECQDSQAASPFFKFSSAKRGMFF